MFIDTPLCGTLFIILMFSARERGQRMKAGIIITGSGSILALTSTDYFEHPDFVDALMEKGIDKYIVFEVPEESQSLLFFKNNVDHGVFCSRHFRV